MIVARLLRGGGFLAGRQKSPRLATRVTAPGQAQGKPGART
jgi:hypothetical protein